MMDMKVKVIAAKDFAQFEEKVNEFLKDHEVTDIQYQPLVATKLVNGSTNVSFVIDRAMITYFENGE